MKKPGYKCVICGGWFEGWGPNKKYGNNPWPLADKGQCCSECNKSVVATRIVMSYSKGEVKSDVNKRESVTNDSMHKDTGLGKC